MALNKQAVSINFAQGLDTKTDPFQVAMGKFLVLENSIFLKGKLLQKRNGYAELTTLPNTDSSFLTTFKGDLTAMGTELFAYSAPSETWVNQGDLPSCQLQVTSLIKNNTNQSQADSAIAANGFILTAYTDQNPANLSQNVHKYVVADSQTGQNIIEPTLINSDSTYGTPRVFVLGNYFAIVYIFYNGATYDLQLIAVSTSNPLNAATAVNISTSITPSSTRTLAFDGVVYNNTLYVAWNGAASSGIKVAYVTSVLVVTGAVMADPAHTADQVSMTADPITGAIWVLYYGNGGNVGYALALSPQLNPLVAVTPIIPPPPIGIANITAIANAGVLVFAYEVLKNYSYDSAIPTHFIQRNTLTELGVLGTAALVKRSVGLASKAILFQDTVYFLSVYQSPYQPTYFLLDILGNIVAKFAYGNGGGYLRFGLPSLSQNGSLIQTPYLFKDLVQSVNKNTNVPAGSQVNGIYAQTGINLIGITFGTQSLVAAEMGQNLNLTGGITWAYDGYSLAEQGFFVYPDSVEVVASGTSGSMTAQEYFYQVTYEWSDNQGNLFRSSPSIPVSITLTSNTSVTINIPTLRLSYKNLNNPVKLVVYRWSAAQQVYYQTTSILLPILNDPSVDSIAITDSNSDATILGNNLLYTTGGVIENIGPPAFDSLFLFDNRLWGIDSEDKNLLWYSKQIIESTPVEMSDLLTQYVSPTIGAQGSTGDLKCGAAMDDKLVLFKATAINYINGEGPDSTGANNQYSQPVFLTSTVGCSNQKSIVFQPEGLMFEFASEAGNQIWILTRSLSTLYIGADVEGFTRDATVESAINIPGTNQVRFTLSSGVTLMYDYYYGQWGTFTNIPAISSVLYQGLHTFTNSFGQVFQETPGVYLDGSYPVLMGLATSWFQLAGLQGYQRFYFFYLLGTYLSPHFLNIQLAYDYNPATVQQTIISPSNYSPTYGSDLTYGSGSPYGGPSSLERWKIYATIQRCQSFQIKISEIYDPSFGVTPGAGFTLSGLNAVVGVKRGYSPTQFTQQAGSP